MEILLLCVVTKILFCLGLITKTCCELWQRHNERIWRRRSDWTKTAGLIPFVFVKTRKLRLNISTRRRKSNLTTLILHNMHALYILIHIARNMYYILAYVICIIIAVLTTESANLKFIKRNFHKIFYIHYVILYC